MSDELTPEQQAEVDKQQKLAKVKALRDSEGHFKQISDHFIAAKGEEIQRISFSYEDRTITIVLEPGDQEAMRDTLDILSAKAVARAAKFKTEADTVEATIPK